MGSQGLPLLDTAAFALATRRFVQPTLSACGKNLGPETHGDLTRPDGAYRPVSPPKGLDFATFRALAKGLTASGREALSSSDSYHRLLSLLQARSALLLPCVGRRPQKVSGRLDEPVLPSDLAQPVLRNAGQAVNGAGKLASHGRYRVGIVG